MFVPFMPWQSARPMQTPRAGEPPDGLLHARLSFDHLAGNLGCEEWLVSAKRWGSIPQARRARACVPAPGRVPPCAARNPTRRVVVRVLTGTLLMSRSERGASLEATNASPNHCQWRSVRDRHRSADNAAR